MLKLLSLFFSIRTARLLGGILFLTLIACTSQNSHQDLGQKYNVVQSIQSMDKNGTNISYKVKYDIIAKTELSNVEIDEIQLKTKWVVSDALDLFTFEDCILKKDSVETIIINEVVLKNKTDYTRVESFIIEEIAIPGKILEQMISRYGVLKDKNIVAQ